MMEKEIKRNILLNPGPATTTDTVKWAQVVPDICPRENEFKDVMKGVARDLVKIVHGGEDFICVLFGGSGTAVMDACINSAVPPNGKIAIIVNGLYGERFVEIANAYGIQNVPVRFDSGRIDSLDRIDQVLSSDSSIKCVGLIHHETTTGILNPAKEIGQIAKKHDATFILDAISTYAGLPIDINDIGADFLLSTSNKCIQGMAGLSFVIARKKVLESLKEHPRRSFYLNLYDQYEFIHRTGEMRYTPPVQVTYALKQAIAEYFEEGEKKRFARYTENWSAMRSGLEKLGFKLLLKKEEESRVLLSVLEPKNSNYSFKALHDALLEKGFTIYPGKISSMNTFRLANLGDIHPADIQNFLEALGAALRSQELWPLQH